MSNVQAPMTPIVESSAFTTGQANRVPYPKSILDIGTLEIYLNLGFGHWDFLRLRYGINDRSHRIHGREVI